MRKELGASATPAQSWTLYNTLRTQASLPYTSTACEHASLRTSTRCFDTVSSLERSSARCSMPDILRFTDCFSVWRPAHRAHASDGRAQLLPKVANPPQTAH